MITAEHAGTRLDRFIRRQHPSINQGRIEKLLRFGAIRVDGGKAKSSMRILEGQVVTLPSVITVPVVDSKPQTNLQTNLRATITPETIGVVRAALIAEGAGWLALNKPSGLACQGGSGTHQHIDGALPLAFPPHALEHAVEAGGGFRLVHRLDKATSGVLVVATALRAAQELALGFERHRHAKTYLALTLGRPQSKQGIIEAPLKKCGGRGHEKMVVDAEGQAATTLYKTLAQSEANIGGAVSVVALRPKTGRTHQLRVHLAHLGCPILGDGKYGGASAFPHPQVKRLCLHAAALKLTGRELAAGDVIKAPMHADMVRIFDFFGLDAEAAFAEATFAEAWAPNGFEE